MRERGRDKEREREREGLRTDKQKDGRDINGEKEST